MKHINTLFFFISLLLIAILYTEITGRTSFIASQVTAFTLVVGLLIPFSLLFLGYKQLREPKVYFMWLVLGIGMLFFYSYFKDMAALQMARGSALRSFKSLFVFLLTFQICRILVLKWTKREYVTPSIMGSDLLEGKRPQLPDFLAFALLFIAIIGAQDIL